jgi:hypothetical protein
MRWILKLYPPAWRRRYEEEMAALLEDDRGRRRSAVDLVRGAADAWAIGPRGPLGGLGMWIGAIVYFIASMSLTLAHRAVAPVGEPAETLYQAVSWFLFAFFIAWVAGQPAARCDIGRLFSRRRS